MKKLKVLGAAGVLSLAIGTSVFAADFSGAQSGGIIGCGTNPAVCMARSYIRPFADITAARCNIGSCSLICGNLNEYCRSYINAANLAANAGGGDVVNTSVNDTYSDAALYDNSYAEAAAVYDDYADTGYGYGNGYCGNYTDADNNGVCDNWQNGGGNGCGNYTDADNNGVCDNWQNGGGNGCGYGNGGGYGGGHHGGGHGRGCNW